MSTCPPYTAGDLKSLQTITETIYGTTPTGVLSYAGDLKTVSGGSTNMNAVKQRYGGSRTFDEMTYEPTSFGYSANFNVKNVLKTKDWATTWGTYTLGALTGPIRKLPTFSTMICGSPTVFNLASGCMVNSFKMSSNGLGTPIEFDADVVCRQLRASTTRAFTNPVVTVGADAPTTTESIIHTLEFPTINAVKSPVKSWNLTINNQVFGVPDKQGDEMLANGFCLASEGVEISFTATKQAGNETWTALKLAKTDGITVTIPVGLRTITLTGGAVMGNDFPTRAQAQYDETLNMEFKGITIV